MANELAASFPGVAVDNASEMPERATHMLLYLCEESWSDDRLAEQVKQVREARLPIVMAHENDTERGGVPFSRFFETTPQESTSSLCIIARRSELILAPPITGAHRGRPLPRPRHRLLFGAAPSGAASTRHPLALTLLTGPAKSLDVKPRAPSPSGTIGVALSAGEGDWRNPAGTRFCVDPPQSVVNVVPQGPDVG